MSERETDEQAEDYGDDETTLCWRCGGDGWGIVGTDWDPEDAINGPYAGEVERCGCCGGSGKAEDCGYW